MILLAGLRSTAHSAEPVPFIEPAAPAVAKLEAQPPAEAKENPDAVFHLAPRPLPKGAVTGDWTSFLGPHHNLVCDETKLLAKFPKDDKGRGTLPLVWEANRGTGYSTPAVLGGRIVQFHRVENNEVVDCLQTTTGKRFWKVEYTTAYQDRYGYCDGPRCSPVIFANERDPLVYTVGAEGKLKCFELLTGRAVWQRDLLKEFKVKQNFFGVGSTPLVEGDKLIVNIGAPGGPCVAAFDLLTGRMVWGAGGPELNWGASYASPVPATVRGKRRVFVFAGGETGPRQPVTGGLLSIDPQNGKVDFAFPWRGTRRESVNASTPLFFDDKVFVSECYGSGGALVEIQPDMTPKKLWSNEAFGTHFMTAVLRDGHLFGVDGHGPADAFLTCVDAANGKEVWRTQPEWKEPAAGPAGREATVGTYRSHLMAVDGRYLCLGEFGHLLWVDLTPAGSKELDRAWLFAAAETWAPPVVSRGLLYVCQTNNDRLTGKGPRLLCYDLRGE